MFVHAHGCPFRAPLKLLVATATRGASLLASMCILICDVTCTYFPCCKFAGADTAFGAYADGCDTSTARRARSHRTLDSAAGDVGRAGRAAGAAPDGLLTVTNSGAILPTDSATAAEHSTCSRMEWATGRRQIATQQRRFCRRLGTESQTQLFQAGCASPDQLFISVTWFLLRAAVSKCKHCSPVSAFVSDLFAVRQLLCAEYHSVRWVHAQWALVPCITS